jgi:hypothetical protein
MAGFDLETQKSYTLPGGGRGETSRVDFSAGSFCQAVATTMTSIYAWNANPSIDVTGTGATYDLNLYERGLTVDIGDITSSGLITKRQTGKGDISASYYLDIKGW